MGLADTVKSDAVIARAKHERIATKELTRLFDAALERPETRQAMVDALAHGQSDLQIPPRWAEKGHLPKVWVTLAAPRGLYNASSELVEKTLKTHALGDEIVKAGLKISSVRSLARSPAYLDSSIDIALVRE